MPKRCSLMASTRHRCRRARRLQSCRFPRDSARDAILVIGIKESANFNSAIVIVKVAIVLIFIAIAGKLSLKNPAVEGELASIHSPNHWRIRASMAGQGSREPRA